MCFNVVKLFTDPLLFQASKANKVVKFAPTTYKIMLLNRFAFEYKSESKCRMVLPAHLRGIGLDHDDYGSVLCAQKLQFDSVVRLKSR